MRGYKLGLLSSADYNNLSQCESLDDIKLYLVRMHDLGQRPSLSPSLSLHFLSFPPRRAPTTVPT